MKNEIKRIEISLIGIMGFDPTDLGSYRRCSFAQNLERGFVFHSLAPNEPRMPNLSEKNTYPLRSGWHLNWLYCFLIILLYLG